MSADIMFSLIPTIYEIASFIMVINICLFLMVSVSIFVFLVLAWGSK